MALRCTGWEDWGKEIRREREREREKERLDVGFAMGKIEWGQCALISWEELG